MADLKDKMGADSPPSVPTAPRRSEQQQQPKNAADLDPKAKYLEKASWLPAVVTPKQVQRYRPCCLSGWMCVDGML